MATRYLLHLLFAWNWVDFGFILFFYVIIFKNWRNEFRLFVLMLEYKLIFCELIQGWVMISTRFACERAARLRKLFFRFRIQRRVSKANWPRRIWHGVMNHFDACLRSVLCKMDVHFIHHNHIIRDRLWLEEIVFWIVHLVRVTWSDFQWRS